MFDPSDTIVAVSTPAGLAGRAIVRLSGDEAIPLAGTVFHGRQTALAELGGFRTAAGWVRCDGLALPGRVYVFRAPRSYTRDDVVELHIPGHPLAAGMLVAALSARGARPAEAGEFTHRAFLNGRIDLSAAEAVAEVIAAATDTQLRAATANAGGALHELSSTWSDAAAEALAEVEASIDLADEQIDLVPPAAMAERLAGLAAEMERTLAEAVTVTAAAEVPRVAMAGAANVGKSSLLNALTGLDRAIVSATAGTTRDVLTAPLTLPSGREVLLADLAGLSAEAGAVAHAADSAARTALRSADAVLIVIDATAVELPLPDDLTGGRAAASLTVLANKIDLLAEGAVGPVLADVADRTGLTVLGASAVTGVGLDAVAARIDRAIAVETDRSVSGCALHQRQREAIGRAGAALARAAEGSAPLAHLAEAAEILAVELRTALAELGTISGTVVTEEVLGRIFARFCVGK